MKKYLTVITALVLVAVLVACTAVKSDNIIPDTTAKKETTTVTTTEDIQALINLGKGKEEGIFSSSIKELPEEYYEPAENTNPVERLNYVYKDIQKGCIIYVPPGYDETKEYNIYYLLGGALADETAFFGDAGEESVLKNVFDHMILSGEIEPFLAVNVNFFYHKNHHLDIDDGAIVNTIKQFNSELREAIIPAVEADYATYAKGPREIDFISSRKHRAFAGFSLGASCSFLALANNLDYFYYYAPLCGADFAKYYPDYITENTIDGLRKELVELDYTTDDFFVYATEGENDNTFEDMNPMMEDFITNYPDLLIHTDNDKSAGNITYKVKPGWEAQHRYVLAYQYYYNSLLAFWGNDLNANE